MVRPLLKAIRDAANVVADHRAAAVMIAGAAVIAIAVAAVCVRPCSLHASGGELPAIVPAKIAVSEPKPAVLAPTKAELVLQSGHSSGVLSVKFSPDGKILVARSLGETILWDTQTGRELRTLAAASTVSSMAFSPDGKVLATAAAGAVIFWDPATGQKLRRIDGPDDVAMSSTAFSPDGKYLVAAQDNRSVVVWDVASGRMLHTFSNVEVVRPRVAFSRDSKQLAIGLTDVLLYDVLTGEKVRTFEVGHRIDALTFGRYRSNLVAVSNGHRCFSAWDPTTGRKLSSIELPVDYGTSMANNNAYATSDVSNGAPVAYSYAGDSTPAAPTPRDVIFWDADFDPIVLQLAGEADRFIPAAVCPNRAQMATGIGGYNVFIRDTQSGQVVQMLEGHGDGRVTNMPYSLDASITAMAYSPDGRLLATGSADSSAEIFDVETGKRIHSLGFGGRVSAVNSVAFAADGKRFTVGSWNGGDGQFDWQKDCEANVVWDASGDVALRRLDDTVATVSALAFSPDGSLVAGGSREWHGAMLWNAHTGQRIHELDGNLGGCEWLAFNADGTEVVGSSRYETTRWNSRTGQRVGTQPPSLEHTAVGPGASCLVDAPAPYGCQSSEVASKFKSGVDLDPSAVSARISSDGKLVASTFRDGAVVVRNAKTGEKIGMLKGRGDYVSVLFSPNDKQLAVACIDGKLTLWDVRSPDAIREIHGATGASSCAAFSPNGRVLLAGFLDGTCGLWNTATGERLLTLLSIDLGKDWLVFTPDGQYDGSEGGRAFVAFREDQNAILAGDEPMKSLYRPGLLHQILTGSDQKPEK